MTRKTIAALVLFAAGIFGPSLFGERLKPPPHGMTYYFMVLHEEDWSTGPPKRIELPDVAKHGGKVVRSVGTKHVVLLPKAAAKGLRADENVAYLQRIWMGESFDDWNDPPSATTGRKVTTDTAETDLSWATEEFEYDGSGNVKKIGTDTYAYDSAGRLIEATVNGKKESFRYDSFGNLTEKAIAETPTSTVVTTVPVDSSSNRVTTWEYGVAGNVVTTGQMPYYGAQYYYDALGMLTAYRAATGPYRRMIYTADDERIGVIHEDSLDRWKLRDFNGRVLREFEGVGFGAWLWIQDYVYADTSLVAGLRDEAYGGKRHFHVDHLGSVRLVTTESRTKLSRTDFYPFGAEQTPMLQERSTFGPNQRTEPLKFTGHERDYHGNKNLENHDYLDYMHARFYDPNVGRFLSVDPKYDEDVQFRPQKWNRYSYAANNPIRYVDPDGRGIYDFIEGAANGWSSSNLGNINRLTPRNLDFKRGQMVGDAIAAVQGFYEIAMGGQMIVGGGGAELLTAGAATPVAVPVAAGGVVLVVHGVATTGTALNNLASANRGSSSGSGDDPREVTPSTNKDAFGGMRGRDAKVNKETGEVWVRDRLHKDHWEVYKNQKDFEKGNRTRSVWDDGRLKETY